MMTEHVYKYWRFRGWIAEEMHRPMRAFFFRDFARQEREAQK